MTAGTPHQALYRRWRAQTFSEIVGQEAVVATLRNAVATGQVAHAILFTGPRGTGKTSLARILAKALNCQNLGPTADPCDTCASCVAIREGRALDLVEIDAASNRGIDAIRELRDRLNYTPTDLRRKVYILDEAHQITRDAWNALLKSLEEPPDFVTFMFASTHPQEFPPAILSRLQRFDVRRLTVDEITGKLERILAADGRDADPDAIRLVSRLAAGGMRDAESILDQLLGSTTGRIEADAVRELLGLADADLVDGVLTALATGDAAAGIPLLDRLEERGRDLRIFLDQLVDTLRERLVADLAAGGRADRALASVARRLAAIDPTRLGAGGLRLQLELALLEPIVSSGALAQPVADLAHGHVQAPAPSARVPRDLESSRDAMTPPPGPARRGPSAALSAPTASGVESEQPDAHAGEIGTAALRGLAPASEAAGTALGPIAPDAAASAPIEEPGTPPARTRVGRPQPGTPAREPGTGPAASDDLERLRRGWPQVVAAISKSPPLKPLISVCRPIAVEGNVVTLGFPEEQAFLKDVAERRRPNLEEGIGDFLGHGVGVRCVATNLDLLPPLPADADAAHILAEAHRIFAEDLADVPEVT